MKTIVENKGKFSADSFRVAYVRFMTLPGSHNDTYVSTCHRMFFANMFFRKLPAEKCPDDDRHNVETVDGLILPSIAAIATACNKNASIEHVEEAAAQCASVTRRSSELEQASRIWGRFIYATIREDGDDAVAEHLNQCAESFGLRRPPGPDTPDEMTACYLSQSVPSLLDMIAKYMPGNDVWKALIANANVGGENVHRGSILGLVLGAQAGDSSLNPNLVNGLYHKDKLAQEIDDFVSAVFNDS